MQNGIRDKLKVRLIMLENNKEPDHSQKLQKLKSIYAKYIDLNENIELLNNSINILNNLKKINEGDTFFVYRLTDTLLILENKLKVAKGNLAEFEEKIEKM